MSIKKIGNEWIADIRPNGAYGKRYRKKFRTKAEALSWEAWVKSNVGKRQDWEPEKRDKRKLSDLVDLWFKYHGKQLVSGTATKSKLLNMAEAMGNPLADDFNVSMFTEYRAKRLSDGISANHINHEQSYLRAVFNELRRVKEWTKENPMRDLRKVKTIERELTYLTKDEINNLLKHLAEIAGHAEIIAKICLSTGARWSEAESLQANQVRNGQITFNRTKSGKNRTVPINESLIDEINACKAKGLGIRLFKPSYEAFRRGMERTGIQLPTGQMTHVLRHTFASHFIMNGGNILTLQKILGHSTITMTMRYAHLAPEHLQEAKTLNPLSQSGHLLDKA